MPEGENDYDYTFSGGSHEDFQLERRGPAWEGGGLIAGGIYFRPILCGHLEVEVVGARKGGKEFCRRIGEVRWAAEGGFLHNKLEVPSRAKGRCYPADEGEKAGFSVRMRGVEHLCGGGGRSGLKKADPAATRRRKGREKKKKHFIGKE